MPKNAQPVRNFKLLPTAEAFNALGPLEVLLGHCFQSRPLLSRAVTHSSLSYERASTSQPSTQSTQNSDDEDNEQLEFLGDAVIGLLVAESLCKQCPSLKEGQLTRLRAALVSRNHLGEVAARLDLGQYLRLGRGEERSGGRKKNAILANAIEAIIGASYLEAGLEPVRLFVEREIITPYLPRLLEQMEEVSTIGDHKSALQELLQAMHLGPPVYSVKSESGPDHLKRFVVEVRVPTNENPDHPIASGKGSTKKRAEQEAAHRALRKMKAKQDTHLTPQTDQSSAPKVPSGPGLTGPLLADSGAPAGS